MPKAYEPKMLILRGINNLLDEKSALEYAALRGYEGFVLPVSGETGENSKQVKAALRELGNLEYSAVYGFSGGAYNAKHILDELTGLEKAILNLIVILGAPGVTEASVSGPWELVYRPANDPPHGEHMDWPKVLVAEWKANHGETPQRS